MLSNSVHPLAPVLSDLPAAGPPPGIRLCELLHLEETVLLHEGEELHVRLGGLEDHAREPRGAPRRGGGLLAFWGGLLAF